MVTLTEADKVLKTFYLDAVTEQMNNKTNPFYAAIKKGSEEVSGKQAVAICKHGINGGMGSATETGALPTSGSNNYLKLVSDLKNIYGTIEISDKALRASRDSATSLVNLLNAEMEGLLDAAKFNFGRMLWQSGTGVLCKSGENVELAIPSSTIKVDDTRHVMEGMIIDILSSSGTIITSGHRITGVYRDINEFAITPNIPDISDVEEGSLITLQQSYNAEINGIPYLYDNSQTYFYENSRTVYSYILPWSNDVDGDSFTTDAMQETLDLIEERSGNDTDMILMGYATRREYLSYLQSTRRNIDYMNLDGGFKALSYNGIPVVTDKFCLTDDIYFVNTNDFKLMQLCDWQWIEGDNGKVLMQLEKTPTYTGTLVKYANLVCTKPKGQGRLTGLSLS
ncbi:MAG: phage major capsid protein [Bacillota bacterium]